MTYEHVEPPAETVSLKAYDLPVEFAKQILICGWNNYYTAIDVYLSALRIYRETVYGPAEWDVRIESVMNFIHTHPITLFAVADLRMQEITTRSEKLAVQLLDYIRFFPKAD